MIDKINENSSEILKEKDCRKCKDGKLTINLPLVVHLLVVQITVKMEMDVLTVMLWVKMTRIKNYQEMENL